MKIKGLFIFSCVVILGLSACRSEFEKIRSSGDPAGILNPGRMYAGV